MLTSSYCVLCGHVIKPDEATNKDHFVPKRLLLRKRKQVRRMAKAMGIDIHQLRALNNVRVHQRCNVRKGCRKPTHEEIARYEAFYGRSNPLLSLIEMGVGEGAAAHA